MRKALIGLTMGDAAGIGPELTVKVFSDRILMEMADMIVIGDSGILSEAIKMVNSDMTINTVGSVDEAVFKEGRMNVLDLKNIDVSLHASGKTNSECGRAACEYTEVAVKLALSGEIDAIASAPVNKDAMHLAGYDHAGQTEFIASLTNTHEFGMVLYFGPVKLFYVTNHVSLRDALDNVRKNIILSKIKFIHETLAGLGGKNNSIAVAAINPHAGEAGRMGRDEIEEIIPAVEAARELGIDALGPFPADTLFIKAKEGAYGAVLAMYHDQGNIAAKLMGFGSGVTAISGLPIIRTSVAHGTAFDIAGKGIASPDTLIQAVRLAVELVEAREEKRGV